MRAGECHGAGGPGEDWLGVAGLVVAILDRLGGAATIIDVVMVFFGPPSRILFNCSRPPWAAIFLPLVRRTAREVPVARAVAGRGRERVAQVVGVLVGQVDLVTCPDQRELQGVWVRRSGRCRPGEKHGLGGPPSLVSLECGEKKRGFSPRRCRAGIS